MLQDELDDRLDTLVQFDKYDQPEIMFISSKITEYIPGAGKL